MNPSFSKDKISLIEELQFVMKNNNLKLKHVDTNIEIQKRKKEKDSSLFSQLMNDIQQQSIQKQKNEKIIDNQIIIGKKYYQKDLLRFQEEIQKVFILDFNMMKFLFDFLESLQNEIVVKDILIQYSLNINSETLVNHLIKIGFHGRKIIFLLNDGTEKIEYISIFKDQDIPTKLILESIIQFISQINQ